MLDGLAPELAPRLLIAIGGVALAFLVLIAVLIFLKRRNSPLFIKGGRIREHRLMVLDAAAIDAKRRLVLIRRDDTEHLIMIGGPTDIVIETGIGGEMRQKPGAAPAAAPSVISAVAAEPRRAEVATSVPAGRTNQGRQDGGRRQRQGQNGENGQGTRAADAGRIQSADVASVSAMGSVLYDDDREPLSGAKVSTQPAQTTPAVRSENEGRPASITAQAESALDQARNRVLSAAPPDEKPSREEDAIWELERQLDVSKAEAARAEAARAETARMEAVRAETARAEAARLESERAAAAKADAERAEAVHAEASRLELARMEAQRAEAAKLEAERAEKARQEAALARQEAERAEAERAEATRLEAERAEAARAESARIEAERVTAARAEAMARFEAARRAQAEQRQAQQPVVEQPVAQPVHSPQSAQWPFAETEVADDQPATAEREVETAAFDEATEKSQQRLASDFEKLLEAELEADGVLDNYPPPAVAGERREPATPAVNPVRRDIHPITGATPGHSIEQDMARRLGEISLNKKNDGL
ncbi:MAG: hypothetical protein JWM58_602 [Rhizobium sp.]|nr:hypothetical protein [Rhizobium sp.]